MSALIVTGEKLRLPIRIRHMGNLRLGILNLSGDSGDALNALMSPGSNQECHVCENQVQVGCNLRRACHSLPYSLSDVRYVRE